MRDDQKITQYESNVFYLMKAFAILSVIAAHTVSVVNDSSTHRLVSSLWVGYAQVGVPCFLIIGGFFYQRSAGDDKVFWMKKFQYLLLPWWCCSALTYFVNVVISKQFSLYAMVKWCLGSGSWYYYITVFVFFLFIFKCFYQNDIALLLAMAVNVLALVVRTIFDVQTTSDFFSAYLNPLYWIGYFALGVYIRKHRLDRVLRNKRLLLPASLLLIASVCYMYNRQVFSYFHMISPVFSLSLCYILFRISSEYAKKDKNVPMIWVGKVTYSIYLLHMQVVQFATNSLPDKFIIAMLDPFIGLALMGVIITAGIYLSRKLPGGKILRQLVGLR